MPRIIASLLAALVLLGVAGTANSTLINFDVDQAAFVAPLAGSGNAGLVEVKDQFASLGVLFRDLDFPTLGPIARNTLFGGSLPNLIYSNDGFGFFDTLTRVELIFVDPLDKTIPGFVNDISIFWTDAGLGAHRGAAEERILEFRPRVMRNYDRKGQTAIRSFAGRAKTHRLTKIEQQLAENLRPGTSKRKVRE